MKVFELLKGLKFYIIILSIIIIGAIYGKYFGKASLEKAASIFRDVDINSNIKIDEKRNVCAGKRSNNCHDVVVLKYFDHVVFMSDNGNMILIK